MKSFLSLTLAGITGGLICFGALHLSSEKSFGYQGVQQVSTSTIVTTGPDFAAAAEAAQNVVELIEEAVRIKWRRLWVWIRRFDDT